MLIFETVTVCLLHLFLVDTDIRLDPQKVLCCMINFLVVVNSDKYSLQTGLEEVPSIPSKKWLVHLHIKRKRFSHMQKDTCHFIN
jgi:hypothetical protein